MRALQDGWTPLNFASSKGHAVAVGVLLANGADVEAKDNVSVTPSRWDAPTREASHKHARETHAVASAGTITLLTQYRVLACITKAGACHLPVLVTYSWPYLALAIREKQLCVKSLLSEPCMPIQLTSYSHGYSLMPIYSYGYHGILNAVAITICRFRIAAILTKSG
jgi:hypothetical protein